MSRAARLGRFEAINRRFIVNFQRVGLRAAARRQAADDYFRLSVLEALCDISQVFALGSCGGRAVERQRALRSCDRRGSVAPPYTFPYDRLANITRGPYNSDALVGLIYARGEGHARRGAQRRRCGREEEDASHLQRMTRLRCSCVAESASRS